MKRKDWIEHNSKLQFNISKYKELIHNLELNLKNKEYENIDIEREIKKMELVNSKITQLNSETEASIESVQEENEKVVEELQDIECKLETYDKLIESKEKLNKENLQILISKTEELEQLRHRKEYISKLIETELAEQRELGQTANELESIYCVKREKLSLLEQ